MEPDAPTMCGSRRTFVDVRSHRIAAVALLAATLALPAPARAGGPPYPPYPPPPSSAPPSARPYYYGPPPPRVVAPPPPLSPAMRVVYAPFYAAGLVLRYGFYYVVVAPLEVFGRALDYGVQGGVDRPGDGR